MNPTRVLLAGSAVLMFVIMCVAAATGFSLYNVNTEASSWAFLSATLAVTAVCLLQGVKHGLGEADAAKKALDDYRHAVASFGFTPPDDLATLEPPADTCECGCQRTSHERGRCSGCAIVGHNDPNHTYLPMRRGEK